MVNKVIVKEDVSNTGEILVNVTVIFTDGTKELFNAVRINKKRVKYGRILNNKFEDYGFILPCNIKEIYNGSTRVIFNDGNRLISQVIDKYCFIF